MAGMTATRRQRMQLRPDQPQAAPASWPLHAALDLGALPTAPGCSRAWTRQILWEWGLTALQETAELLVSELVTNAMQVSSGMGQDTPVRLRLLSDGTQALLLVWDASLQPPVPADASLDDETGRGLQLVQALSTWWGWYFPPGIGGKVVWAQIKDLSKPMQHSAESDEFGHL